MRALLVCLPCLAGSPGPHVSLPGLAAPAPAMPQFPVSPSASAHPSTASACPRRQGVPRAGLPRCPRSSLLLARMGAPRGPGAATARAYRPHSCAQLHAAALPWGGCTALLGLCWPAGEHSASHLISDENQA